MFHTPTGRDATSNAVNAAAFLMSRQIRIDDGDGVGIDPSNILFVYLEDFGAGY